MAYKEWGSAENERVLVCVHGLARNSRDFDDLALALSRDYRVICPDVVGRGESDWLPPGQEYGFQQYLNDMTTLLARLNVDKVDWVGTSMGGIIGMCLAALPNSPIKHLVLNDIGGFVAAASLQRISTYLGDKRFSDLGEVEAYMRTTYQAYRNISDSQWQRLAKYGARQLEGGEYALHYDPMIAETTRANSAQDVDLWPVWSAISVPQLLIWGDASDVLGAETVTRMQENARLSLYRIEGIEHAPSLMEPEQIQHVQRWLREHRS
jgi:pimeloyl-ACP methyl ester carboxylesterase